MAYIGLDTEQHERTAPTGSNPLPAGMYNGVVTRTELKDTKPDAQGNPTNGKYLEVEFDITHPGEFSNRKFWDRFNIVNKSQQAQTIGKQQLADLAKAAGIKTLGEDTELHGREVSLVLRVKPPEGKFQASNECQKYWPVGTTVEQHDAWFKSAKGSAASAPAQKGSWGKAAAAAPAAEAAPAPAAQKPWAKKTSA